MEEPAALLGDVGPFFVAFRLGGDRADAVVALHPPAVGRMRLADVDHHEVRPVLVPPVKLFDIARVAAERPAGETAEHQDDGLGADQLRQGDLGLAVVGLQGKVRGGLVELGPGLERTDLLAEQAADERGLGRTARCRRRRPLTEAA